MNVAPAWQKGYTGKGVVVSILDDGIQTNHPDLVQNYVSIKEITYIYIFFLSLYIEFCVFRCVYCKCILSVFKCVVY